MLTRGNQEREQSAQSALQLAAEKREEIAKINVRLKKLLDSFLDEIIDRDAYVAAKENLMSQRKTLEEQKARLMAGRADWLEPLQNWILAAKNAGEIALRGSPQERKVLAGQVFGSNLVLDCKKARGSCVKRWSSLLEHSSCSSMVGWPGLEPGTNGLKGRCSTD